jgi:hypothetical protein
MKYFDDANLVTSLINAGFTSHYYHTYIEKNNIIYDLSTGIVGDKDEYYNLFEPKEIVTTNKLDLDSSYDIARTSGIYNNSNIKAKALRIALYNQIKK